MKYTGNMFSSLSACHMQSHACHAVPSNCMPHSLISHTRPYRQDFQKEVELFFFLSSNAKE